MTDADRYTDKWRFCRKMIDGRIAALFTFATLVPDLKKNFAFIGGFLAIHRYKGKLEPHLSIYLWKWHLSIGWKWVERK